MKNKRLLAVLAMTLTLSCAMTACNFGGEKPEEVVEVTPTPEPTAAPTPKPTIAPDVQNTKWTSKNKTISIKLPDATWTNKADEEDMLSFESPEQGKILILHGKGDEDMSVALIPDTRDMAVTLEQASDLVEGTDFEVQDYTATDVNGIGVYSYTVKMLTPKKTGGFVYVVNKVFANDGEFYSIAASVKKEKALNKIKKTVDSFQILDDSTLKAAAPGGKNTDKKAAEGNAETTEGTSGENAGASNGNAGGFSEEALSDTSQTRTIYRNSDGKALVITPSGNGNWVDANGNSYSFETDEDVYDQDGVDYYYHGEAADVYYMPVE